ncbi:MAG: hypothetical protein J0M37_06835 [Ignavibacteria bacterium]|nr:hypothetical protein [Ignavibacteria bacterium]
MNFKIIEYLIGLIDDWKTLKGFLVISLIFIIISIWILSDTFNSTILLLIIILFIIWIFLWLFFSRIFIIGNNNKKIIAIAISIDPEVKRNFKRIITRVYNYLSEENLSNDIKFILIPNDLITNIFKANKYLIENKLDLILWGNGFYGNLNNEKVYQFKIQYTLKINEYIKDNFEFLLNDISKILFNRAWNVKEANELDEIITVSDNLFEVCLYIIGIYFISDDKSEQAIKLFNNLKIFIIKGNADNLLKSARLEKIDKMLAEAYFVTGLNAHLIGEMEKSRDALLKIPDLVINKIPIYITLARTYYFLGDLKQAKYFTDEIRLLDKNHSVVFLNNAFFSILNKNYKKVRYWYEEFRKLHQIKDLDLYSVIEFLENEFNKNKSEFAYIYGLAIVNGFIDIIIMKRELKKFITKAKKNRNYRTLIESANNILKEL